MMYRQTWKSHKRSILIRLTNFEHGRNEEKDLHRNRCLPAMAPSRDPEFPRLGLVVIYRTPAIAEKRTSRWQIGNAANAASVREVSNVHA
jgi:hypothetical protein